MPTKIRNTARDDKIEADFRAGTSITKLGEEHGISRQRVSKILHARGLGRLDGGMAFKPANSDRNKAIVEGFWKGACIDELSMIHRIAARQVRRVLDKSEPPHKDMADELLIFIEAGAEKRSGLPKETLWRRAEEKARAQRGRFTRPPIDGGQA